MLPSLRWARWQGMTTATLLAPQALRDIPPGETRTYSELAAVAGTQVMPHLYGGALGYAATLQLAACAAPVSAVEYDIRDNPLRDPLLASPPTPERGEVALPGGPGLGVTLVPEALDAYTESSYATDGVRSGSVSA